MRSSLAWTLAGMALLYVDADNAARARSLVPSLSRFGRLLPIKMVFEYRRSDLRCCDDGAATRCSAAGRGIGRVSDIVTEAEAIISEMATGP